jgi:hypothetical protein
VVAAQAVRGVPAVPVRDPPVRVAATAAAVLPGVRVARHAVVARQAAARSDLLSLPE